ncbi:MAG: tRNA epoxyqueuosine(34) reductase QueG [Gammaproteobacteria bacterium]
MVEQSSCAVTVRPDPVTCARLIKQEARALGFSDVGVTHTDLCADEALLDAWLAQGYHGEMAYLAAHGTRRSRPAELVPGTLSVVSVALDYLPQKARAMPDVLADPVRGYVARYALGRDYHKVVRGRLRALARRVERFAGPFGHRVFSDSAPVLEKALARNAGLGWIGKHTNLLNRARGSWFFLGEIYTDLPLSPDPPYPGNYCGTCTRCLEVCPTRAIVAPYRLDARRCISYLTIESRAAIPEELRGAIGNRIFGCDDCQTFCPWNRDATFTVEADFAVRHGLDDPPLLALWTWDEGTFLRNTEGSALRRLHYTQWRRNLAVALGNAPPAPVIVAALQAALPAADPLVREHIEWALRRQLSARG